MNNLNIDNSHKNLIYEAINEFSNTTLCKSIDPVQGGMSGAAIYKIVLDLVSPKFL